MPFVPDKPGSFSPDAAPAPSTAERIGAAVQRGTDALFFPQKMALEGLGTVNNAVDKAAYEAGGYVTDKTGSPELGAAANMTVQAVPMLLGGGVTKAAATAPVQSLARRLMQSAIKPSAGDLLSGDAARAVQTMLDEGINATPAGMAELRSRVGALHKQVESTIASSTNRVGTEGIPSLVNRAYNKFRYSTINPDATRAEIQKAVEDYLSILDRVPGGPEGSISVQIAQKMKRANQQQLADEYGSMSRPYYEAQKDITRGLREGIEKAHPEVAIDNAKMEQMLNALSVAEKHSLMALNKNPAGLTLLAENPKAAAAFMADRSSAFKSILARMLNANAGTIPTAAGAGAVGAYNSQMQR